MFGSRPVSKACSVCKARRIKCDETRPHCQRCIRSDRQCAYAMEFDLIHRDQTRRTELRVIKANSRVAVTAASSTSASGSASNPVTAKASTSGSGLTRPRALMTPTTTAAATRPSVLRHSNQEASSYGQPPTPTAPSAIHASNGSVSPPYSSTTATASGVGRNPPMELRAPPVTTALLTPTSSEPDPEAAKTAPMPLAPLQLAGTVTEPIRADCFPSSFRDSIDYGVRICDLMAAYGTTETSVFVAGQLVDAAEASIAATGSRLVFARQRRRQLNAYARGQLHTPAVSQAQHQEPQGDADDEIVSYYDSSQQSAAFASTDLSAPNPARYMGPNWTPQPDPGPRMHLSDMALCYFASNFMLLCKSDNNQGFFEYLLPTLRLQPYDSSLHSALRACAFAILGNRIVSSTVDLRAIAISQYTAALAKTTSLLKDIDGSKANTTLATVLLLGLFEQITAHEETVAWRSHISGAIHILKARGAFNLQTRVDSVLFHSVRVQLLAHSLSADVPGEADVSWWMDATTVDSTTLRCHRLMLEIGQLRREWTSQLIKCAARQPDDIKTIRDIYLRARDIDNEMARFLDNIPARYHYRTISLAAEPDGGDYERAEFFPGKIDVFPDMLIANVWLMARTARLILWSLLMRCIAYICDPVDYRTTSEYAYSVRVCNRLFTDILASIPYFLSPNSPLLRYHLSQDRFQYFQRVGVQPPSYACGVDDLNASPKALAGLLIVWPLASVYSHDYTSNAQRSYIAGRFRFIRDELGVRYGDIYNTTDFRYPSMMIGRDRISAANLHPESQASGRVFPIPR